MSLFFQGDPDADRLQALIASGRVERATLVALDFASGPVYLTNRGGGFVDRQLGRTWRDTGDLAALDPVQQSNDMSAFRELRLGVPFALMDEGDPSFNAFDLVGNPSDYAGQTCTTYLQYFDEHRDEWGRSVPLGFPKALDVGVMSKVEASVDPAENIAVLTMRLETLMVRGTRPEHQFLTDQSQQALFPGDLGLQFVAEVEQTTVTLFEA